MFFGGTGGHRDAPSTNPARKLQDLANPARKPQQQTLFVGTRVPWFPLTKPMSIRIKLFNYGFCCAFMKKHDLANPARKLQDLANPARKPQQQTLFVGPSGSPLTKPASTRIKLFNYGFCCAFMKKHLL